MKKNKQAGFSLLEVVMAMALLGLFTVIFVQLSFNNFRLSLAARQIYQAGNYAQLMIEYLQGSAVDLSQLLGQRKIADYPVIKDLVEPGWRDRYQLITTIKQVKDKEGRIMAGLYQVDILISCSEAAQQELYRLSTMIYQPGEGKINEGSAAGRLDPA